MTGARLERAALVLTPIVALATVAAGLHVGASSRVLGARVYAAPPGAGRGGVALQLVTVAEESGVQEIRQEPDLTAVASAHGVEARWQGSSNAEGVAEAWLDLPSVRAGDEVALSVTTRGGAVLARGTISLPTAGPLASAQDTALPAMRRSGPLVVDVFVYGKLIPGLSQIVAVPVLVRVRGATVTSDNASESVTVTAEAEPGLAVPHPRTLFCQTEPPSNDAWCQVFVTAEFLTASWTLTAKERRPDGRTGTWYGALPVSPAGAVANLHDEMEVGAPQRVRFVLPPAARRIYVEVTDDHGIDLASALEVEAKGTYGLAEVQLPDLAPGDYWLVTSSSYRGADATSGSTVARPFRVSKSFTDGPDYLVRRDLLVRPMVDIPRPLALDGLLAPRRLAAAARRRGMLLAFGALSVAAVLETLLILQALRRGRIRLHALSEATLEAMGEPASVVRDGERSRSVLAVATLLFITLLGFALLAGLLAMSSSA